jgi:hypothetical protein
LPFLERQEDQEPQWRGYNDEYVRRGKSWLISKRVSHFTWRQREEIAQAPRRMIEGSLAKRAGTPDEVGAVGALLKGRTAASSRAVISSWMAA